MKLVRIDVRIDGATYVKILSENLSEASKDFKVVSVKVCPPVERQP